MKRVLVTGAGGFIGSHCIAPLLARGFEVHAVARAPRGGPEGPVHWHACDLLETGAPARLVEAVRPTHLLHLAWYVVPGKLIGAPENYDWVKASLDLAVRFAAAGGKRAAVCGSGYEYDWRHGYCSEDLTPCVPDTAYGACKNALREMLRIQAPAAGVSLAWPRVFFLYGPREHPQRLVSSVIRSLLRGEEAKTSHGRQIRDYLHVQDVADGIVAVLDSGLEGPVNVSSGEATTLRDIVLAIGRLTGRPERVRLGALPARANDLPLVVGAAGKVAGLGWSPRFDLEAGLADTIAWWKRHGQGEHR